MNHIIDVWGYWAVAFFVLAESFGVPLPGETAVIIAGTYAGHTHHLSPWLIFAVAAGSSVVGGQVGYLLGRLGGTRLVRRWGHKIRLDEGKLRISRYLFDTYGTKVVFLGRFVSILRTYAAFFAGTCRMEPVRFAIANAVGGVVWAGTFAYLSYVAGNSLRRTSGTITWVLAGAAVAVMIVVLILARQRMSEFAAKANVAYPDESD